MTMGSGAWGQDMGVRDGRDDTHHPDHSISVRREKIYHQSGQFVSKILFF